MMSSTSTLAARQVLNHYASWLLLCQFAASAASKCRDCRPIFAFPNKGPTEMPVLAFKTMKAMVTAVLNQHRLHLP